MLLPWIEIIGIEMQNMPYQTRQSMSLPWAALVSMQTLKIGKLHGLQVDQYRQPNNQLFFLTGDEFDR